MMIDSGILLPEVVDFLSLFIFKHCGLYYRFGLLANLWQNICIMAA